MKVSVNWLRSLNEKYHCAAEPMPDGIDKLVQKIGAQLGAVEEVINVGDRYKGIVVVKVVKAEKHPNADKLSLCLVDDGGVDKKVKRDADGLIQIVCGAHNVKAGMLAVWIPPGSSVPASFDKEPFVIEARPIRNKTSHGMLASPKELALGEDHDGILEITEAKPGDDFAKTYHLDDFVIDIENKMFTHRPDLFGILGLAREIAGIQGHRFKSPDWYKEDAVHNRDGRNGNLKLEVRNQIPKLVPRFCAQVVKDVKVAPSPLWLLVRLNSVGIRSINNIVDITNFYMMETAQPLHAFDYDKIKTGSLGVRLSIKGEKLMLLNGKELTLEAGDAVITDGQKPVGLAGIMGGADTEVDQNTKNIILECANFDMNQVRKTAMRYGLFTDASTRFTKNQSPRQNRAVITVAANDVLRVAGGRLAGPIVDIEHLDKKEIVVKTDLDFINNHLGLKLSIAEVKKLLENVEFKVTLSGQKITVTAPFWRTDIKIAEDIVEEVGRLYGYDHLPQILPTRSIEPAKRNEIVELKDRIRQTLKEYGANEVLTYSFIHGSLMQKVNLSTTNAYKLKNAISPDLQYYRMSLSPSLLVNIHPNLKRGYDRFGLFEFGKAHIRTIDDEDGLPRQLDRLALVLASNGKFASEATNGSAFFWAKKYLINLLNDIGITYEIKPLSEVNFKEHIGVEYLAKPFDVKRSAGVVVSEKLVGVIGEYNSIVNKKLKLPSYCAGFEIFLSALCQTKDREYRPLNKYPETEQDICLRTSIELSFQTLNEFVKTNLDQLTAELGYNFQIVPLDIFKRSDDMKHKQLTFRIHLWHPERTLTTMEINNLMDQLADKAKQELKAERV